MHDLDDSPTLKLLFRKIKIDYVRKDGLLVFKTTTEPG
jgi:hypothetical protein